MSRAFLILVLALVLAPAAAGSVRLYSGSLAVVDDPYGPPRVVDLATGRMHALYRAGRSFSLGSGWATPTPSRGRAVFDERGATIAGRRVSLLPLRAISVRFRSGGAMLAGTLFVPPGRGRRAAVAYVTGSGPTTREYLPELQALLLHNGVAVLAYDKRGIGGSGGSYPGDSPTEFAIDQLARDAAAAARFLAGRAEVDPARIGLAGHSQAGWIMPLAATREPAIRFLVTFSGPAVTADENDLYQTLAGEGEHPQRMTDAAIDARVERAGPGGVDPMPWISALGIPALWLYGSLDHIVPPRLSAKRLAAAAKEPGRDFAVWTFPRANHALVETKTGLTSEMLRSDRYARGMFPRVGAWLRAHGLT
ncbi:MAG TPA: alpha/beta hydrolase [Gaiella sp.]|jgi:dienelactone hydrolase|nr:alpha/beta hydrolase [Gaiella sp.]